MGLFTVRPLKKFEFHKSKMADGRHFKNRYIILSQQPFDWLLLNLARWCMLVPRACRKVEIFNFWQSYTRLNMSHVRAARVWHVQPRVVLFPCPTNDCVSYVLSFDQLQECWIICKLKSFSPLYLHDLNTQARGVIFGVSKTLCDFGHKSSFKEE